MNLPQILAALAAPEAVTLIDLVAKVGPEIVHRLADTPPAELAALRARLQAVEIGDTAALIEEGRRSVTETDDDSA